MLIDWLPGIAKGLKDAPEEWKIMNLLILSEKQAECVIKAFPELKDRILIPAQINTLPTKG